MLIHGILLGVVATIVSFLLGCSIRSMIRKAKARKIRYAKVLALADKHAHGLLVKIASEMQPGEPILGRDVLVLILENMGFKPGKVSVRTYSSLGEGNIDIDVKGSDILLKLL